MKSVLPVFLTLFFSLVLLNACGTSKSESPASAYHPIQKDPIPAQNSPNSPPTNGGSDPIKGNVPSAPPASLNDRVIAAKEGRLYCPFNDECEPAVALVSVVSDEGIVRCTGFLISEDEVMTNDHCLKSISSNTSEGNGLIFVHFAKAGEGTDSQNLDVQRIEKRSFESGVSTVDYAILKLAAKVTDRSPVSTAREGFQDAEKAKIFRVQMTSDLDSSGKKTYNGIQTKLECEASLSTVLYPAIDSNRATVMTFGDCAIQLGNSGSPIFNTKGEVGAILQGVLTVKQDATVIAEVKKYLLDDSFGQLALGTQLRCLVEFGNPRKCDAVTPVNGIMPEGFLKKFLPFSSVELPALSPQEKWLPLISEWNLRSQLKIPLCLNQAQVKLGTEFYFLLTSFKKGINHFLKGEWRSQVDSNNGSIAFHVLSYSVDNVVLKSSEQSSELSQIEIPLCK